MKIEIHSCAVEKDIMSFPMGALCIKSEINATSNLPESEVYEHYISEDPTKAASLCASRSPSFVGLSLYIWNITWFESFAANIRRLCPDAVIFAGGPQIAAFKDVLPKWLDFAVCGEGEISTVNLLKSYIAGNKPERKIYESILPDTDKMESVFLSHSADSFLENSEGILWELTRGCPFKCAFCYESRGKRTVRDFPMDRINKELDYIISHDIRNVFVLDPTFNLNQERAKTILRILIDKCPPEMHFTFEIRAELVDSEMVQLFATLNCSLQIGLQSCNPNVLEKIGRTFDKSLFEQKVRMLAKEGVAFGLDIIVGLPGDNLSSFRKTVDFAVSLQPSNIDCFILSVLPGTELERIAPGYGLVCASDGRTVCSSSSFSSSDMADALSIRDGMDLFYTKGQSCMWIHCILEALNITACNLFLLFGKWMKQTSRSAEEDIWVLQDDFVRSLFEKTQNNKLIAAMTSFMELHQGLCYVTDTMQSAQLDLSYHPDELALLDSMSLSEFTKTHRIRKTQVMLEMQDGEIVFR